jgi:hypothetical protein
MGRGVCATTIHMRGQLSTLDLIRVINSIARAIWRVVFGITHVHNQRSCPVRRMNAAGGFAWEADRHAEGVALSAQENARSLLTVMDVTPRNH